MVTIEVVRDSCDGVDVDRSFLVVVEIERQGILILNEELGICRFFVQNDSSASTDAGTVVESCVGKAIVLNHDIDIQRRIIWIVVMHQEHVLRSRRNDSRHLQRTLNIIE